MLASSLTFRSPHILQRYRYYDGTTFADGSISGSNALVWLLTCKTGYIF